MKASVFVLPFLCGMAIALKREYIFFTTSMNWTDAQIYCTENYGGLATITTDEENQKLGEVRFAQGWIGLYRSPKNSNTWLWSYSQPSINFSWCVFQPNNYGGHQNCVSMTPCGWNDLYCGNSQPFYCNKDFDILVKEKMTWEAALDYCRTFYTGLASMSQLQLAENDFELIQSDSVWTGLHFLNGKWFWVSGELLGIPDSLASCPIQSYSCGAYNFMSDVWENRNCNEKLNFVCY